MLLCVPSWWVSPGLLCTCWISTQLRSQGDPQQDHRAFTRTHPPCASSSPGRCPAVLSPVFPGLNSIPHLQENPRLGLAVLSAVWDLGTFSRQHGRQPRGWLPYFCFSRITVLCLPAVQYLNITIFLSSFVCLLLMWGRKSSPDG